MRAIQSFSDATVRSYIDKIHREFPDSLQHTYNRLNTLANHSWWLVEVDLRSEIGTVVNNHDHTAHAEGKKFTLSTSDETWLQASLEYPNRIKHYAGHPCIMQIGAISR